MTKQNPVWELFKDEMRMEGGLDPWGTTMSFAFKVSELLYWDHDMTVMDFRPGMSSTGPEMEEEYPPELLALRHDRYHLEEAAQKLERLIGALEARGLSY